MTLNPFTVHLISWPPIVSNIQQNTFSIYKKVLEKFKNHYFSWDLKLMLLKNKKKVNCHYPYSFSLYVQISSSICIYMYMCVYVHLCTYVCIWVDGSFFVCFLLPHLCRKWQSSKIIKKIINNFTFPMWMK